MEIPALEIRKPQVDDIPFLNGLWEYEERAIDFTIRPESEIIEWYSPNPSLQAEVYVQEEQIIGYTRRNGGDVCRFLAQDTQAAQTITAHISQTNRDIVLPLHPLSASTLAFETEPQIKAWEAGMAFSLAPNPFEEYFALVQAGKHPVGRVLWHPAFEIA
jgi:hypothetical protein